MRRPDPATVWLFDLDDTLHDAGAWVFGELHHAMGEYVQRVSGLAPEPAHFLHDTHRLPGLEQRVTGHRHDFAALARLPGAKLVLTNAPRAYAQRVLRALRIERLFDGLIAIEDMAMFGQLRPKPDSRMLRALAVKLGVAPTRCVLVEDTLAHQKAAHAVGMGTVWMQRYARRRRGIGPTVTRWAMRPPYVDRVVRRLAALCR